MLHVCETECVVERIRGGRFPDWLCRLGGAQTSLEGRVTLSYTHTPDTQNSEQNLLMCRAIQY